MGVRRVLGSLGGGLNEALKKVNLEKVTNSLSNVSFEGIGLGFTLASGLTRLYEAYQEDSDATHLQSLVSSFNLQQQRASKAAVSMLYNHASYSAVRAADNMSLTYANMGVSTVTGSVPSLIAGAQPAKLGDDIHKLYLSIASKGGS